MQRRAGSGQPCAFKVGSTSSEDEAPEKKQSGGVQVERGRPWISIVTEVAQLALHLIRAAREGTDLYRKIRFEK